MAMETKPSLVLDGDDIAPRTEEERYRIYRVKDGGAPDLVATAATPEEVGVCICLMGSEGMFDDCCLGVLDSMDHQDKDEVWIGKWLVLPWMSKSSQNREEKKK